MSKDKNIPANKIESTYKEQISRIFENMKEEKDVKIREENNPIDEVKKTWDMNDKILNLFAENIGQDQKLRSKYAIILIGILIVELIALITIFILKGCGVLNYSDTTFNIFVSGGIAEVFVLVKVIVEYLFKDNLTEALKIIISTNNNKKIYKNKPKKNNKTSDKP